MISTLLGVLVDVSLRATVVAALVGGVLLIARVGSSSVRHAAWTAVLVAMLAMPVLPSLVPAVTRVTVPVAPSGLGSFSDAVANWAPAAAPVAGEPAPPAPLAREVNGPQPLPAASKPPVSPPPASPTSVWPAAAVSLYLTGVLVLLVRFGSGVSGMRRLLRHSERLDIPAASVVAFESPVVSVPLTAGVFSPIVILPPNWPAWSQEKLDAVLAHERAHIARHDSLILCLAHLNRIVFWFHPLAWWLERQLAVTAEHACDDAAVNSVGEEKRYAEILLEMAATVRRRRGRVQWAGVGIDGAGLLGQRNDRVLRGGLFRRTSRTKKALVALGCTAAIAIVAACRQQQEPQPLQEDPAIAKQLRIQQDRTAFFNAATSLTPDEVTRLEETLAKNPEDLEVRKKLIIFYDNSGQKLLGWDAMIAAKRRHVLWLIGHHADEEWFGRNLMRPYDPAGYREARSLWLAYRSSADATPKGLANAADFFTPSEKPIAEEILLHLLAVDPKGPQPRNKDNVYYPSWTERLGTLYALAILGSNDDTLFNVPKSLSADEARGPFTTRVRQKLETTKDARLLQATGAYLANNASQAKVDFDHVALGRTYLDRALAIDPSLTQAARLLRSLKNREEHNRAFDALRAKEAELAGGEVARKFAARERLTREDEQGLTAMEERAVAALPEDDRFRRLPELAAGKYIGGEASDYTNHDTARANAQWALSKKYAQEVLALGPKFQNDPSYGGAIRSARITLGTHALREGDRATAVRYLAEAAGVPTPEDDETMGSSLEGRLINYLLKAGERESVARYLERSPGRPGSTKTQRVAEAAAIRAGKMPLSYQYMVSRER